LGNETAPTQDRAITLVALHTDHTAKTMKALSLLNIIAIAIGLGACANGAVPRGPYQAPEIRLDNPAAQMDHPPLEVRIRSISWAGSGCAAGTVASNLEPGFRALTLLFDSIVAEIGPGVPISLSRRSCQLLVDLDVPQGWSYSVVDVDYRGSANLDPGVSAVQRSTWSFRGQPQTARLEATLTGPFVGDYQIRDSLGINTLVWSPCGAQRALIINESIRLVNNSGSTDARGVTTTGSINDTVKHIYGLQWRRCPL
jgi:hypothetical protein